MAGASSTKVILAALAGTMLIAVTKFTAADPGVEASVRQVIARQSGIQRTNEVLSMHLGPDDVLLNLSVDFKDSEDSADVERAITEMEAQIKRAEPKVRRIFIEAQSWRGHRRMA